jgi:hypothetical protein
MLAEKVGKKWGKWETNSRQLKIFRSENRIEVQHKQQIGRQVGDKWETSVASCGAQRLVGETSVESCGPEHPERTATQ